MARVVKTCKEHNVPVGHPHVDAKNVERVLSEGYRFLMPAPVRTYAALEKGLKLAGRTSIEERPDDHRLSRPLHLRAQGRSRTSAPSRSPRSTNGTPWPTRIDLKVSDDEIRAGIDSIQLKFQRERGIDRTIFSPRASAMGHHLGDEKLSLEWTQICNDIRPSDRRALPERLHRRLPAPASRRRAAGQLRRASSSAA